MKRMWINQPSKDQPLYSYHGVKVLSDLIPEFEGATSCKVYFTEGNVISMSVPFLCLSGGWPSCEPQGILERFQKLMYVVDGARSAHYIDDAALGIPLNYSGRGRPFVDWHFVRRLLIVRGLL